ncbi:MAG: hypothetical protein A2268_05650 [Candidatus Raymondbacteria bacterium RifOxyA12_full_50_37]|uniref:4-aminobutyrate aminotransferase n=1 Tax=Candidatus Raymondbacteria bacterium RIFOXYD12_FULL_49_13 TaxID=1817890 RepID=A0A1F7F542_UNCRA|nr:MAG: hypothetical protein A2268_05650 [Candidatus Raymondbacteria bacterium RifOxyA12_full_50_37]OGJ88879.1 MAG: hypothetical protein A2350_10195 [Candidatus Raymondbacteria bacterium RifOxyB12_full_50_8]OGJ89048.1 MAG: hypothetical protein A2248_02885 [Candidatus Raymondbacteria bacterium RIFOXYA2_FULL_49_16]OGJ93338.1 MAG: hypothetical protein A2487_04150 [Candidatus Raymondbacteria bacterium RifOxyC12_full_50_8]OGJ97075.1 MAG: hypothetical protein A2453_04300 [Candidatus Raymondbacteria b
MGKEFLFEPVKVKSIKTKNRVIKTPIPVPASKPIVEMLRKYEPISMAGQPLIIWDRARGVHVFDRWGNKWLDFSSGVLVTNAGHAAPEIEKAIVATAKKPMHHSYCFPNAERAALVEFIVKQIAPKYLDKVFLLTTGSEAVECALKICRAYGHKNNGRKKDVIISFESDFHGRTMGSQMAGGSPALKDWIVNHDPNMINVPCPDGFRGKDQSFNLFLRTLREKNIDPKNIAGVIMESFQGGSAIRLPVEYMKKLRTFLDKHKALLIFDEVQACIGRSGKMFTFEHYGVRADLICCGKGITSGLPLSTVIGKSDWMNIFPPGSMTSTHTGNPIICAAALANLKVIKSKKLVQNSAKQGIVLAKTVKKLWKKYPDRIGWGESVGLVGALQMVTAPGTTIPDHDTAFAIVKYCVEHGLMLFGPVGNGGGTVKICPPLCITREQLEEGLGVLEEGFDKVCGKK